jgi:hypothetical protein
MTTLWSKPNSRPASYWAFGDVAGGYLSDILPDAVCSTAAATCRFQLRGKYANGNTWGLGVITSMMTYRNRPRGTGLPNQPAVQYRHNFIELTADDGANVVLDCFGLTITDVMDRFGHPGEHESYWVDLKTVIETLCPSLLQEVAVA